jgi:hypothetical protein
MTKVQLEYKLTRPVDDAIMDAIARAHGIYGLIRLSLAPSLDRITVEYDASRLSPLEIETILHNLGIAAAVDA